MKKQWIILAILLTSFQTIFSQNAVDQTKRIADYIKGHTEADCRKVFNNSGFNVITFMNNYPTCLDGYSIYTNSQTFGNDTKTYQSTKHFSIEKGRIISYMEGKLSCDIVFTLTAKDRLSSDCIIFIGSNGFAYILNLFKFEKATPISFEVTGFSFVDNNVKAGFVFGITGNTAKEKNNIYDFAAIAKNENCIKTAPGINSGVFGDKNSCILPLQFGESIDEVHKKYTNPVKLTNPTREFYINGENIFMAYFDDNGKVNELEIYVAYGNDNKCVMYPKPVYGITLLCKMEDVIKAHGDPIEYTTSSWGAHQAVWKISDSIVKLCYETEEKNLCDNVHVYKNSISRINISKAGGPN
jgi:hypothetical protein